MNHSVNWLLTDPVNWQLTVNWIFGDIGHKGKKEPISCSLYGGVYTVAVKF